MFCQDWLLVRFLSGLVSFLKWIFSHPSKDDSCASRSTAITVFTKLCFLFIRRMEKKVNQDSIWRLQFVYSTCDEIKREFCSFSSLSMKCGGHGLGHETFFWRKTDLLQWWCYLKVFIIDSHYSHFFLSDPLFLQMSLMKSSSLCHRISW